MRNSLKRVLAIALAVMMLVGIIPMSTLAANVDVAETALTDVTTNYQSVVGLNVIEDAQSTLAPGVKLNEVVAFDKNGSRVEMYVTTVDTTVDTVQVYANYKDNQCSSWGLQTLSEQVAALEAKKEEPFTVVAGINASYYNTTTGKPTGAFVMEGVDVTTESEGNNYAFFAVLKDGTYMIGNKGDYSTYKGQIKEAIGGYVHIVKDGAVVSGLDKTTKYPRQTIGLTKDGKLILMTADGSQTKTVGLTYQEQAEVMLAMGCEDALHLDGGNSATFGGIREGTKEFVLINSPSGLAERAVSNTLCIVSTAVADGTFDHATISGDYEYFVPNSTYTFTAKGIDASGGPADEIPADVTWALSDPSFGTISDGKFVSNGKTGDVAIQMVQGTNVVGSKDIHIVNPTSVSFDAEDKTIPYAKSAPIVVTAMYNLNEVYSVATDYDFVIANSAAGSISGFTFTATTDETIKSTTVTATYKYVTGISDTVNITFGKGSEVLFDFENGDISDWHGVDTIYEWIDEKNAANPDAKYPVDEPLEGYSNGIDKQTSSVFLASEENGGKVKNGKYSLGFVMDHKNVTDIGGWLYNYLYYTGETKVLRDVANGMNGIRIGMWVYSPDVTNVAFRIARSTTDASGKTGISYKYMNSAYDGKSTSYATNYAIPETGWIYVYYDLTDLADNMKQTTTLYDPDNNNGTAFGTGKGGNYYPAFLQLFTGSATDTPKTMTYYIDDITIDYSDVTDDRDAPTITDARVSANVDNFAAINGQTVNNNCLSFEATVAEVEKNNATGLDYSTAKIYVDGVDVSSNAAFKCAGNTLSLTDVYLNNGKHQISFEIADKQGNYTRVSKALTVAGTATNAVVSIVGRNELGATPKAGSIYFVDINTTDASQVKSLTTTLKLDLTNKFEYENIICAEGVKAEYKYDELDRELTVTLTHDGTLTGAQTLASIPVRVWAWDEAATGVTADKQFATGAIPTINIELKSVYGSVVYADGTLDANYICGFYGSMNVATELDNKTAWHKHTAEAVADKAATCTASGYKGRTYCDECKSVVDWGKTVPATGHKYEIGEDSIFDCSVCGEKYTGVFDGKDYVDGVLMDGWVGDSYYLDGEKLTGVQKVEGYYYDFGEDGVCDGKVKYTGLFSDGEVYRYSKLGVLASGWQIIDSDWYYFEATTMAAAVGELKLGTVTYEFEETGRLAAGVWVPTLFGLRYYYGPDYHRNGWQTIAGKDYFFENGVRLENGWQLLFESQRYVNWYFFNEDGTCDKSVKPENGFYTDRNGLAYAKDGCGLQGVQLVDGTYYYFNNHGYCESGTKYGYVFGEDYKAVTGILETNNGLVYYKNGKPYLAGLIEIDGDYYFVNGSNGEVCVNEETYVWQGNGIVPESTREFGADGKMLNGIVERDGKYYYYDMGQPKAAGLVEVDGAYYFANGADGEICVGKSTYVWQGNGIIPESTREFGADGKMLNGIVEKDGTLYYYENGKTKMAGLIEIDGAYYFVNGSNGEVCVNKRTYVWAPNGIIPESNREFGADGKMLDGIVEKDGTLYYYVMGNPKTAGLVEVDGALYFANGSNGEICVNKRTYVWQGNGIIPESNREFGADGKMLDGIVEKDGTLYYYVMGNPRVAGLVEVDGALYFANGSNGEICVDKTAYVWEGNGILPEATYTFGADGKMLEGIVEKNGTLYYYEDGKPSTAGLIEIDGAYYFVNGSNGEVCVDETVYVWQGNGIVPESTREFGADGKMLDGFITREDGIYYYEMGKPGKLGLFEYEGDYYFVKSGDGLIVTNQRYYAWETNGLSMEMNYTFDEAGRVVGY